VKAITKFFERLTVAKRLGRDRLNNRQRVLHAMAEFGDKQFAMPLGALLLGRVVERQQNEIGSVARADDPLRVSAGDLNLLDGGPGVDWGPAAAANWLGFADHLAYLKFPGRVVIADENPPKSMIAFVAAQIGCDPSAFAALRATRRNPLRASQRTANPILGFVLSGEMVIGRRRPRATPQARRSSRCLGL
jgi:Domain of unknown function (DUF4158)